MIIVNSIQVLLLAIWTFTVVYIISPFLRFKQAWWLTVKVWAPGIRKLLFSKIEIRGLENVDPNKHYIFMANHSSYYDIACLFEATNRNLHFIAKQELGQQFFTGYMLRKLKIIFIDRSNAQNSIKSLRKAADLIKDGKNVAIFPEGTRTKTGKLGVFRKGGVKLAIHSQTPIIPVCIKNSAIAWPRSNFNFKPTTITIIFGKEIETKDLQENDTQIICDKVMHFMKEECNLK